MRAGSSRKAWLINLLLFAAYRAAWSLLHQEKQRIDAQGRSAKFGATRLQGVWYTDNEEYDYDYYLASLTPPPIEYDYSINEGYDYFQQDYELARLTPLSPL